MDISHVREFQATPDTIFSTLMNSSRHSQLTGSPAQINAKQWAPFAVFNGAVKGINLTVIPNKKIVQRWQDTSWPENHFSTVTIKLKKASASKTILTLLHTNIPSEHAQKVEDGWHKFYWDKLHTYLKRQ